MNFRRNYRAILRSGLNKKNRDRFHNKNLTIISQNCVGGVILHELGLRFNTPTVNLWFSAEDFIKILERPRYYFNHDIIEVESKMGGGRIPLD